jgi:hypothetical protein
VPTTVFDARGLELPPFDQGFPVGRGSLMPLLFTTTAYSLPGNDSVEVYGSVPEHEVWRVLRIQVHDAGGGVIPQWQALEIALKLGEYVSTLPPGEGVRGGPFVPNDDTWLEIWQKYGKLTGAGFAWWRTITGWSYGPDLRWLLPKHTFETWLNEDGKDKNVFSPVPNLSITVWPAGVEWRVRSNSVLTTPAPLANYSQQVQLVVLRLHETDVRAVNPLTVEGLG